MASILSDPVMLFWGSFAVLCGLLVLYFGWDSILRFFKRSQRTPRKMPLGRTLLPPEPHPSDRRGGGTLYGARGEEGPPYQGRR